MAKLLSYSFGETTILQRLSGFIFVWVGDFIQGVFEVHGHQNIRENIQTHRFAPLKTLDSSHAYGRPRSELFLGQASSLSGNPNLFAEIPDTLRRGWCQKFTVTRWPSHGGTQKTSDLIYYTPQPIIFRFYSLTQEMFCPPASPKADAAGT